MENSKQPNVVFLLADQLRACSLPYCGESQIETPNINRLAAAGVVCGQALSTAPICTPYRAMLLTGRHPQTTGHVGNFIGTRYDEISIADAFKAAGYRTGWVGKWHLQVGAWPGAGMREGAEGAGYVPAGRPRLGFEYWRGYNFHETYFNGWVDKDDWRNEIWDGYETNALNKYAMEFMDQADDRPFCLFVSPHQPHKTCVGACAPEEYYRRLPSHLELPENVPDACRAESLQAYRDYLAMVLAVDDMLGELLDYLERTGKAGNTLVVFTSDHGSQFGAHALEPWNKAAPYEESVHVPLICRLPGRLPAGGRYDGLVAPVDLFPTLCGICDVSVPRSIEGWNLAQGLAGREPACTQDAVFMMNCLDHFCFPDAVGNPPGQNIWRAVRSCQHTYIRRYNGDVELYNLTEDPLQLRNLTGEPGVRQVEADLAERLDQFMLQRKDRMCLGTEYRSWFDGQRRVIRNAYGELSHPESPPDWSLLD